MNKRRRVRPGDVLCLDPVIARQTPDTLPYRTALVIHVNDDKNGQKTDSIGPNAVTLLLTGQEAVSINRVSLRWMNTQQFWEHLDGVR